MAFYRLARAADDVADNPRLTANDKITRLDSFARAISGAKAADPAFRRAYELGRSLADSEEPYRYVELLIDAFKRDAVQSRYETFEDLLDYCRYSAAPVGRFLIDLHRESPSLYPASDALCIALQLLNHLQDCRRDYISLNRIYLPQEWMQLERADNESLRAIKESVQLRRVFDRCLDATDELLKSGSPLPCQIQSRRFGMEAETVLTIARTLSAKLRRKDLLANHVKLSKAAVVACFVHGIGSVARFRRV